MLKGAMYGFLLALLAITFQQKKNFIHRQYLPHLAENTKLANVLKKQNKTNNPRKLRETLFDCNVVCEQFLKERTVTHTVRHLEVFPDTRVYIEAMTAK